MAPPPEETVREWLRRWPVVTGAALVLLVSSGAAIKRIFRAAPVSSAALRKVSIPLPSAAPASAPAPPLSAQAEPVPPAAHPVAPAVTKTRSHEAPSAPAPRTFNTASLLKPKAASAPAALVAAPPALGGTVFNNELPALPAGVGTALRPPAPPPAAPNPAPPASPVATPPPAVGGRLEPVQPISVPAPEIPQIAKERRIFGLVVLAAVVDTQGAVTRVKVVSGNPILAPAALEGVKHWRYKPAILNGKPVASDILIQVRFELGNR